MDKPVAPRPAVILGTALVVFFGAQFLGSSLVGMVALALGVRSDRLVTFFEYAHTRFLLLLVIESLSVWAVYWLIKRFQWSWKTIGLSRWPNVSDIGYAVSGFLVYLGVRAVVYAAEIASGVVNTDQKQQIGFDGVSGSALIFVFASLVILAPIAEEILFRGYLFHGLRKRLSFLLSLLSTSLLFGAAHLEFGSGAPLNWTAMIDTLVLSLVLCFVVEKTKSLWPAMFIHAAKNALAFTFLFVIR